MVRTARRRAVIALVAIACSIDPTSSALASTETPTVLRSETAAWARGERMRVTSAGEFTERWSGRFGGIEADTILLLESSPDVPPLQFREAQIATLEQSVGMKRHPLTGAIIGLVLGAAVGAAIAASNEPDVVNIPLSGSYSLPLTVDTRPAYAPIGAAAGLLAGGVVGYFVTTDRWELAARLR